MFSLIELPYALDALEPVISARTLEFHHGKHLKGYVDNLNKLIVGSPWESLCHSERNEESVLLDIVRKAWKSLGSDNAAGAMFNNAGQILNHNMYFEQFSPCHSERSEESTHPLMSQILHQWGTLDAFKADFVAKGVGLFGSGWVWLSAEPDGKLVITQEPGASNPVVRGLKPVLTFDVWEHAYYLDYQNRRADHLSTLWQILDWKVVESRFIE